eukprot:m.15158 g.15158  ORF g.15158 m.15158 type:complete len:1025 (-) comp7794_c0_seq2:125-3199(-)
MNEAVLSALWMASQADREQRETGESQLKQFAAESEDFLGVLSNMVVNPELQSELRQLAAVLLKQNTPLHWDPDHKRFVPPLVPDHVKAVVRTNLLQALADQDRHLRSLAAYCISVIANYDWPEAWPDLFDNLNALLTTGSADNVHGVMRVLTDFVNCLDDQQLPAITSELLPKLYSIVTDASRWDLRTRTRAVNAMTKLIVSVFDVNSSGAESLFKTQIAPILPEWCHVLASLLSLRDETVDLAFQSSLISAATAMVRSFSNSKKLSKAVFEILAPFWALLTEQLQVYMQSYVNEETDREELVDEDGNLIGFDSFVFNSFEFIEELVMSRKLKTFVKANLSELLSMGIAFLAMTEEQTLNWLEDVDQFVADESDESYTKSVRIAATRLIEHVFEEFSASATTQALLAAVSQNIEQSLAAKGPENPNWWKQCEASMLAFSLPGPHLVVLETIRAGKVEFDLTTFMNQVLSETAQCFDCPFLVGRSLLVAGRFAEACSPEAVAGMLEIAMESLSSKQPIPVQVGALKALHEFCRVLLETNPDAVRPHAEKLISELIPMISSKSKEFMREVIDTLYQAVRLDPAVSIAYGQKLVTIANAVFLASSGDAHVADAVGDLFSALAEIPAVCAIIVERGAPTFVSLVEHHHEPQYTGVAEIGLQILTTVVKHCPAEVAPTLMEKTFVRVLSVLLRTEDIELLQTGGEFIRMFVSVHYPTLAAFEHEGSSALVYVTQVIAHVLSEGMPESASAFIGGLITAVILKAGDELGSYVNDILTAVLLKMQSSHHLTVLMSLIFIFARLANENTAVVIDFLVEKDALAFVMDLWCENHDSFYGDYEIKVSTSALTKVLMSGHPALDSVLVRGDLIEEKGIRTRSKTKKDGGAKYTQIPVKSKIFKILVNEYQDQLSRAQRTEDDDDEEEDGDDEDEEWEDLDGGDGVMPKFAPADEFFQASDMIDLGVGLGAFLNTGDEEEEDDPDILADPIYHIDLKSDLLTLLQSLAADPIAQQTLLPALNAHEQQMLQEALSSD